MLSFRQQQINSKLIYSMHKVQGALQMFSEPFGTLRMWEALGIS